MTINNEKYSELVDEIFDAALNHWQIRGLVMIDTPFVAGLIEGLRDQIKEILADALSNDGTELD